MDGLFYDILIGFFPHQPDQRGIDSLKREIFFRFLYHYFVVHRHLGLNMKKIALHKYCAVWLSGTSIFAGSASNTYFFINQWNGKSILIGNHINCFGRTVF